MKLIDKETKEMFGFVLMVAAAAAGLTILLLLILTPVMWLDGHAKAAYLKQTQHLDLPWYQATWLDVKVQSVDANVHSSH